jgi:hypothetical protein
MTKKATLDLFPGDVLRDIAPLSATARGVWLQFLLFAHSDGATGRKTLRSDAWTRALGCTQEEFKNSITEIAKTDVGIVEVNGQKIDDVTTCPKLSQGILCDVTLINRRMEREHKKRENDRLRKQNQRESQQCHSDVPSRTRAGTPSPSPSPSPKETPRETPKRIVGPLTERSGFYFQIKEIGGLCQRYGIHDSETLARKCEMAYSKAKCKPNLLEFIAKILEGDVTGRKKPLAWAVCGIRDKNIAPKQNSVKVVEEWIGNATNFAQKGP